MVVTVLNQYAFLEIIDSTEMICLLSNSEIIMQHRHEHKVSVCDNARKVGKFVKFTSTIALLSRCAKYPGEAMLEMRLFS